MVVSSYWLQIIKYHLRKCNVKCYNQINETINNNFDKMIKNICQMAGNNQQQISKSASFRLGILVYGRRKLRCFITKLSVAECLRPIVVSDYQRTVIKWQGSE